MWWYDEKVQRGLFGQDYPSVPDNVAISRVFSTLMEQFPEQLQEDSEIRNIVRWRTVFEWPSAAALIMEMQANGDLSKAHMVEWLDKCCRHFPCIETIARTSRNGTDAQPLRLDAIRRQVPQWYIDYLRTGHFKSVRDTATKQWMPRNIACVFNQRHGDKVQWHHNDYGLVGTDEEWQTLIPICGECHEKLRIVGPSLPMVCPPCVGAWIRTTA